MINEPPTPALDKPGAGLPFLERLYVRYWVGPFLSRRSSKDESLRLFRMAGARLLKEAGLVPETRRDERVLIPRMRGIEDSSRFWSANETLEHLLITGRGIREIVMDLTAGRTPRFVVRVEDVKPKGAYAGADARADFKAFVDETLELLAPLPIVDAGPTHRHPWLGDFNALQWTWLLAGHSGLHLEQLTAIRRGLTA